MQNPRTVAILGGGIGGLTAAYYLARRVALQKHEPLRILIFERSSRFGGWISSRKQDPKLDSHIFELGPRTLRLQSGIASFSEHTAVNTLKLLENLDLLNDQFCPIAKTEGANKNRLIFYRNNLINMNDLSPIFGGKPLRFPPIVYALYEYFSKVGRFRVEDETIKSFIYRRFGSGLADDIVDYLLDPVMKGVYAGDVQQLSARTVLKKFFELEQTHGSIIMGLWKTRKDNVNRSTKHKVFSDLDLNDYKDIFEKYSIYYFRDGMEVLIDRLITALRQMNNVEFIPNESAERIEFFQNEHKPIELLTTSKKKYMADHLISALPAFELAKLLDKERFPVLRTRLNQIAFVNMVVINLLYKREDIYPTDAFGYLVPTREDSHLLGVLFDSCIRKKVDTNKRGAQLTVMMGGFCYEKLRLGQSTDDQLLHFVRNDLKKQMNLDEKPLHYSISRLNRAIPNYNVGHQNILDDIYALMHRDRLPLSLVGNSYRGVGISDVIYDARMEMEYINFQKNKNN